MVVYVKTTGPDNFGTYMSVCRQHGMDDPIVWPPWPVTGYGESAEEAREVALRLMADSCHQPREDLLVLGGIF